MILSKDIVTKIDPLESPFLFFNYIYFYPAVFGRAKYPNPTTSSEIKFLSHNAKVILFSLLYA